MARTAGSHSDITGPRIREAALNLFAQSGYAAVSMRQIAGAVGVQAGALYNYTEDKQSLLFSLMDAHMKSLLGAWAVEPRGTKPTDQLKAFVCFHIRFNLERAQAVFISYMELRNLSPENFLVIEEQRRAYETELEKILTQGVNTGEFRVSDAKIASLGLIAMLTGVNTWYRAGGRLSLDEVQDTYWDMTRQMVGAR